MDTIELFLAHALQLEKEARRSFSEMAETMDLHHNSEVADLFKKMTVFADDHFKNVKDHSSGLSLPDLKPWEYSWAKTHGASPETLMTEQTHYLMTPHHALTAALDCEKAAYSFYAQVAADTGNDKIRTLATKFSEEEAKHIDVIERWLKKYPEPDENWDHDMDHPAGI